MDADRRPLTPHRREHWGVDPEPERVPTRPTTALDATLEVLRSPDESRGDAKRLLWRDSAIILVWILLAIFVLNYLPGMAPTLLANQTEPPGGAGVGASLAPGRSGPPGATLGPAVDPGLGSGPSGGPGPGLTQPPTGTSKPAEPGVTPAPTPRPTRKPPATISPASPPPSAAPTPDVTPPPPTDPPPTEPPPPPTEPPPPPTDGPT